MTKFLLLVLFQARGPVRSSFGEDLFLQLAPADLQTRVLSTRTAVLAVGNDADRRPAVGRGGEAGGPTRIHPPPLDDAEKTISKEKSKS